MRRVAVTLTVISVVFLGASTLPGPARADTPCPPNPATDIDDDLTVGPGGPPYCSVPAWVTVNGDIIMTAIGGVRFLQGTVNGDVTGPGVGEFTANGGTIDGDIDREIAGNTRLENNSSLSGDLIAGPHGSGQVYNSSVGGDMIAWSARAQNSSVGGDMIAGEAFLYSYYGVTTLKGKLEGGLGQVEAGRSGSTTVESSIILEVAYLFAYPGDNSDPAEVTVNDVKAEYVEFRSYYPGGHITVNGSIETESGQIWTYYGGAVTIEGDVCGIPAGNIGPGVVIKGERKDNC